ncbi:MAG: hypothetical protein ABJQ71_14830 [Roseibium sp.]
MADFSRQKLATATFEEAISIQDEYAGSYAGAAHSLATLAILAPTETMRSDFLIEAQQMAATALQLDAKDGWSQSAASWVAFASRGIRCGNSTVQESIHAGSVGCKPARLSCHGAFADWEFRENPGHSRSGPGTGC